MCMREMIRETKEKFETGLNAVDGSIRNFLDSSIRQALDVQMFSYGCDQRVG